MKLPKAAVGAFSMLAALALLIPVAGAQGPPPPPQSPPPQSQSPPPLPPAAALTLLTPTPTSVVDSVMSAPAFNNSVFANSYVTGGATSTINGDVLSGLYLTTGAFATINGDTACAAATTLGASAIVNGTVMSGSATTLGASALVDGAVVSGTTTTFGASAEAVGGSTINGPALTVSLEQIDVFLAQGTLSSLPGQITVPPGNIATDVTFTPGVYEVNGLLTFTAGVTITLDAENKPDAEFIFNISNYMAFGAGVDVVVVNGTPSTRVIWNATGGYISVGAHANIIGTVMAHGYVSTGAYSTLSGVFGIFVEDDEFFDACGGAVYSATSYVSVGAGATVGTGAGCMPRTPECETCELQENPDGSVTIKWCDGDENIDHYHVYRTNCWGQRKLIGRHVDHDSTEYTDVCPPPGSNFYEVYAVYCEDLEEENPLCTGTIYSDQDQNFHL
jgi:hypothetical protein